MGETMIREKQEDFGAKYGNGKIVTKKAEWKSNMETELRIFEAPPVKIHPDGPKATSKRYKTEKPQALMAYTNFGLKIHLHTRQTCCGNE